MDKRFVVFAALVILGTITREAIGVILLLAFFVAYPRRWQWWLALGFIFSAIFIGLRLAIPASENLYTVDYVWRLNTESWRLRNAMLYHVLFLPLWGLLVHRITDDTYRMILGVIVPYVGLLAVLSVWQETRLLMPIIILLIPLSRGVFDG